MFIVLLRFAEHRARAAEFMAAHKAWVQRGIDDGAFLLVGSLQPQAGGAIVAHGITRENLETRLGDDPFVQEDVVRADILEIAPNLADRRLAFLVA